ncbi:MAG: hypothetical protein COV99_08900 [Bacteroidetes bacterium CG12_big_fil_rev_8_21_14_0_65_60_17]|nr:MAG: hypothetical protein COV99_08900 [Bacteroidetes bacterium CG12_big_fil_rev_8_21_14_0_65_60_17]
MTDFLPFRLLLLVLLAGCTSTRATRVADTPHDRFTWHLEQVLANCDWCHDDSGLDSLVIDPAAQRLEVYFNDAFAQVPFRDSTLMAFEGDVLRGIPEELAAWHVDLASLGAPLSRLVPNLYSRRPDPEKTPVSDDAVRPLVDPVNSPWRQGALRGRHIAVWPSHGWYWEGALERWEWQRARLFQTVEDLLPFSFVVPYLAPMLERAGANVHMPRERDMQMHEVVVDNDGMSDARSRYLEVGPEGASWRAGRGDGFAFRERWQTGENPFEQGTYRIADASPEPTAELAWVPDIPEAGRYAVYVSWARLDAAAPDAEYVVHHTGGKTSFRVDQRMGGGTWVYLGTFRFEAGVSAESGAVRLSNRSRREGALVSADAVRFGGGMGNVERGGQVSGRPRFMEGARYFMQYAGMPADLVYNVTESTNDYVDDYRGRAEWVNYLRGRPEGPNKNRLAGGLGIPIDLSLAFHTDAGVTRSDSTVGTLMIYSSTGMLGERSFPDGMSRFANRDLADIMQTLIVEDIRALYDTSWTRRDIWDRDYSEAVRPNVPGVLLELLSHQNFADMQFALDPRFRHDVARSIYKAMVRFLAAQHGEQPVITPLAPDHLSAVWSPGGTLELSWEGREDPLEPSASPAAYVVYMRRSDGGYDNGRLIQGNRLVLSHMEQGVVYGFRVSAVNRGGESLPSEEVAVASAGPGAPTMLVVSAFDRLAAPASIDENRFRGFGYVQDEGVSDGWDPAFVGHQYDFDPDSRWLDDDSPGHGASYATWEAAPTVGNTFDYAAVHARAALGAGWSVSSVSDERFVAMDPSPFDVVNVVLGEERRTHGPGRGDTSFEALPPGVRESLSLARSAGASLLLSGAHVATDSAGPLADSLSRDWAERVLLFRWRTDHASERGDVNVVSEMLQDDGAPGQGALSSLVFNTRFGQSVYRVESPDALEPVNAAETLLRYADNNMSAATGHPGPTGVVVLGFPFETIRGEDVRRDFMRRLLFYLHPEYPYER